MNEIFNDEPVFTDAVFYGRYSSELQSDGQSIPSQRRNVKVYAKSHNIRIVNEYIDEAFTATNSNRPSFQRMLKDAKEKKFKHIIVHKFDRFSRDSREAKNIIYELQLLGIKITSVLEDYGDTPEGLMQRDLQLILAEYYSNNLSREVSKGLYENAYNGIANGSTPLIGYRINPETRRYEINPDTVEIPRLIFKRFVYDRWSYREISEELRSLGYKTSFGNDWNDKSAFYDILSNKRYIGIYTFGRTYKNPITKKRNQHRKNDTILEVPDMIPKIIDEETFYKAQEILEYRKRRRGSFKAKENYILSGLIFCGKCGNPYHGNARWNKAKTSKCCSYRCAGKTQKLTMKCTSHEILKDTIESYVINTLTHLLNREDITDKIVECCNQKLLEQSKKQIGDTAIIRSQMNKNSQKTKNLLAVIETMGIESSNSIFEQLEQLENERKNLEIRLRNAEVIKSPDLVNKKKVKAIIDELKVNLVSGNDRRMKDVIRLLIHKIYIYDEGVEIQYSLDAFSLTLKENNDYVMKKVPLTELKKERGAYHKRQSRQSKVLS
ncbi:recombinase family protein [[Clostridium] innocuum]|nr:recombinase family protein [[Clostridium] innocuum]MCR0526185.1 recombinase family protein [[Clostridium] innocuum]MCR0626190.1 recombinase family protein [[Clostridium] innocuum]